MGSGTHLSDSWTAVAVYDDIIFKVVREAEADLEQRLDADIVYFNSEIRMNIFRWFREVIEKLDQRQNRRDALAIFLTTTGGQAEVVEKFVEVIRQHFGLVHFVVPVAAMSAGTIFCMSGDRIYMDYSSSLGPIDPQVPDREGKFLIPAPGPSRQGERDYREVTSQHDHARRI